MNNIVINTDTVNEFMSKDNAVVSRVPSGEVVKFNTLDCFGNWFYGDMSDNDCKPSNPATGAVYIEGGSAGKTLKITVLDIELGPKGVVETILGKGCLASRVEKTEFKVYDIISNKFKFNDTITIECEPMIGVLGVAPAHGSETNLNPGCHGSNMDCKNIKIGSVVYLPIFVEGALLSVGDLHANMGDGEVGYSGLEIDGSATLRVEVIDTMNIQNPFVVDGDNIIAIYSDLSLEKAVDGACISMCDFLTDNTDIEVADAIRLLTLVGDAGICQTVNQVRTAKMKLPKKYLEAYGYAFK